MTKGRTRVIGPTYYLPGEGGITKGYTRSYTPPYDWVLTNSFTVPSTAKVRNVAICLDQTNPGPPYRSGGGLNILKFSRENYLANGNTESYRYKLVGNVADGASTLGNPSGFLFDANNVPDLAHSTFGDPSSYGATGWNMYKPGKPGADLGVFIAEMKDIPHMLRETAKFFRDAGRGAIFSGRRLGNTSLNVQFGWMPFLNDMCKFYNTHQTLDKRIGRLIQYNGRWERRGGPVAQTSTVDDTYEAERITMFSPAYSSMLYVLSTCKYRRIRYTNRHIWFEAAFRYYIPEHKLKSVWWNRAAVAQMFGGTISPSVLWEATPWSWLIDWFSNAGDVFANMSDGLAENLAAKYAYVMGTTEVTEVHSHHANGATSGGVHFDTTYTWTSKTRLGADPFGFGLTVDDFSIRQWSILASLGLARSR